MRWSVRQCREQLLERVYREYELLVERDVCDDTLCVEHFEAVAITVILDTMFLRYRTLVRILIADRGQPEVPDEKQFIADCARSVLEVAHS